MSPDDLSTRIAQMCRERFEHNDATLVIDQLASLGYTFEVPGVAGRYTAESDEGRHSMTLYLVGKTGLPISTVRQIMQAIHIAGLNIREPDAHPCGDPRCKAPAFANIPSRGAGAAAAQIPEHLDGGRHR
jgi:hypothetical protein